MTPLHRLVAFALRAFEDLGAFVVQDLRAFANLRAFVVHAFRAFVFPPGSAPRNEASPVNLLAVVEL